MSSPRTRAEVVVIGGGAAGMMAAGTAASEGKRVVLLEPNEKLGRKLRITGKGRCNVTNDASPREVIAAVMRNPKFLYSALNAFPPSEVMAFFEGIGVPLKTERGRRVFPASDNANDVADHLASWMRRQGVTVEHARAEALLLDGTGKLRALKTDRGELSCERAVVCTGGESYPGTGSTGDGYTLAASVGHHVIAPQPSLVPLESPDGFCEQLAGLAPRNVTLTLWEDGKPVFSDFGEMLFAHFGVTGPLVLSASAHMCFGEGRDYRLLIDFKPALTEEKLDERVLRDFEAYKNWDFFNALSDLAPKSLIPVLVELSAIPPETKVHSVTREQRHALVRLLKAFPVNVSGPRSMAEAIVTRGGVDVGEINPRTMASKLVPGLYFAGEVLDLDAYTGGYNLQIAWSTGRCAGLAAGKE